MKVMNVSKTDLYNEAVEQLRIAAEALDRRTAIKQLIEIRAFEADLGPGAGAANV